MLNWLGRPKYASSSRRELPAGLWIKCPRCANLVYRKELERSLRVCPRCGYHHRLSARDRLAMALDGESFEERDAGLVPEDPLGWVDEKPYPARIEEAQRRTGLPEAIVTGTGTIEGRGAVVGAMEFGFLGGSMGSVVGEKVARCAELARETRRPLVLFSASGGARMQEGTLSLLQMAKTSAALSRLADAGVAFISVLCDPTTGGVAASFAFQGDVIVAEPGALVGFAGRRVIEQTIRQKLPDGFQTAEFLLEHGLIDAIVPRQDLRPYLGRLLRLCGAPVEAGRPAAPVQGWPSAEASPDGPPADEHPPSEDRIPREGGGSPTSALERGLAITERELAPTPSPWQRVQLARHPERPKIDDYIAGLTAEFVELHGDRAARDDPAIVAGLGLIDGRPAAIVGHAKGRDTRENIARNFGMPSPEGYRKAVRVMKLAEKLRAPVVTLIDTQGAYPGKEAEERGQSEAIARALLEMARLRAPIVTVIAGEGGSGGALAIGMGDVILMLEHAVYSVISPEGCAAILWRDGSRARDAAAALRITAQDLVGFGIVDEIIPEPPGGAHRDREAAVGAVAAAVRAHLARLRDRPIETIVAARFEKFRRIGRVRDTSGAEARAGGRGT